MNAPRRFQSISSPVRNSMKLILALLGALLSAVAAVDAAPPLRIDLTPPPPPAIAGHLGLGTTNSPGGRSLWADSQVLVEQSCHIERHPNGRQSPHPVRHRRSPAAMICIGTDI
jgi:hypothetical protein